MKKIILCSIVSLLSFLHLSGQNDPYTSVIAKIIKTYNEKNYSDFYALLSADFKAQQSKQQITDFLKNNLYPYFGAIKKIDFVKKEQPFRHYKTTFEKGNLELLLACNEKMEISGLSFQPYREERIVSDKAIVSDNKKQSVLDLEVDSLVKNYMSDPANAGLSIGIIQNGLTFFYHYGETKKETAKLPTNTSIYEIGSVTKTFTGILLAKAIEEQKVKADDDIRHYLPPSCKNLSYKNTPVTLIQLSNHTAGIPRIPENLELQKNFDGKDPYKNYTKELLFDELSKLKLEYMPGTKSVYSNTGMALLGVILAEVYHKSYAELVKEMITGPLNMDHTFEVVPATELAQFCTGYNENGHETSYWSFADLAGCGGLRSTLEDMTTYVRANIEEKDPAITLSHAATFQVSKYNSIGMAWNNQQSLSGTTTTWHNGGTYGFSSFIGMIKSLKSGVVVLSNSGNNVDELAIKLLKLLKK
jgi:CubicO group peptidase (beta-lactamase class C family)